MNRDIFLTGYGQTRFGELWEKSLQDLMAEATEAALKNSGMNPLDIDLVVVGNMLGETLSGQAHLGAIASSLLPHQPPAIRVESACGSGAVALHTATAFLESKRAETVLVIGAEKMTDASADDVSRALMGAADAETDAACGLTFPGIFGLIARRYMHEYGLTREKLSLVSAFHHANAVKNPFAQFRSAVSPEAVSKSPLVADPLRLLDCSPISDGAAACILSTTHRSEMRLAASRLGTDHVSIVDRAELTSFSASKDAMNRALAEAEIKREDIAALETHDCFSIAAVINMEDLGFAEPGEGIRIYEQALRDRAPFLLNQSGGLKACGHPVAATGVKQLIDIAHVLSASKSRYGLAHNFGGAAASAGIHILENLEAA